MGSPELQKLWEKDAKRLTGAISRMGRTEAQ
jgi:hypothetical protein